jgi:tRNA nucleotidyltransferase/poly(A) polymerase
MEIKLFLTLINKAFLFSGWNLYFIGGASRNIIEKQLLPSDLDFSVQASPDETVSILDKLRGLQELKTYGAEFKILTTGKEFGTISFFVELLNERANAVVYSFEITSTRMDIDCFGRNAKVQFCRDFKVDSERRDFTINAIYIELDSFLLHSKDLKILDFHNSVSHLKEKKIVFIGDPRQRIKEDYLRIIRYIRFCALYRYSVEDAIVDIILQNVDSLQIVSRERQKKEIWAILGYKNYTFGLYYLVKLNILKFKLKLNQEESFTEARNEKLETSLELGGISFFVKIIKFVYAKSAKENLINNLSIIKEAFAIEREEVKVIDFYIKNYELIELIKNKNYRDLMNYSGVFEAYFEKEKKDVAFFKNEKNWHYFSQLIPQDLLKIPNIKSSMKKFFIDFYLAEFGKNEFYLFDILKRQQNKIVFLKKRYNLFCSKRKLISPFTSNIQKKEEIGKFILMCV